MREEFLLCDQWSFMEAEPEQFDSSDVPREGFLPCDIPHDFLIYNSRRMDRDADGWYRRILSREINPDGRRIYILFDGVYMDTTLYVNGRAVGDWKYGYTAFHFDITDYLCKGDNELLLVCRLRAPNSRWYSGAGIYRDVRIRMVDEVHVVPEGVYVHTDEKDGAFDVTVWTEVSEAALRESFTIEWFIHDPNGRPVATGRAEGSEARKNILHVEDPKCWSTRTPQLYQLTTRLYQDGMLRDELVTRFGLRSIRLDPDLGFFLNGESMKLRGVCLHHDLGALGAAFSREAMKQRLLLMKEMGANAVRLSHNPMSREFLALCDELGLMAISEFVDMWRKPKNPFDYARFFEECVEKDVASWMRRDRNHPSVILWSIGNEIYDTHEGPGGIDTMRYLLELTAKHDPLHNARATLCSNYMPWENTGRCADELGLIGYNYGESLYDTHHREHPDRIIFGSETSSIPVSRGIYHFPLDASFLSDDDAQCSSLGNSRTSWGALSAEHCIDSDESRSFSLGQFVWSGIDYIGEPTPYQSKSSFLGLVDTAGFPKDIYYFFQAAWVRPDERPILHLFPYWDFNIGQIIDVRAVTNLHAVELLVNGVSRGKQWVTEQYPYGVIGNWRVPYEPGVIEAIAYDSQDRVVARESRSSFGNAARLILSANRTRIAADGQDLVFITVTASDVEGNPVENAVNRVFAKVSGAARLVGIDNGDSSDYDSYKGTSMRLFSGKLGLILASRTTPGPIALTVSSPGLIGASMDLYSDPATVTPGISATDENRDREPVLQPDIPVRKIELRSDRVILTPENRTAKVSVTIHPADAVDRDLSIRIANKRGIDVGLASFEKLADDQFLVTAKADGEFSLRVASRSGGTDIRLYSSLDFRAEGLGVTFLDPYDYIAGGRYTLHGGDIGNGNDRGFASARFGPSYVGFTDIDFGSFGSDEITLDVFCLDSDPLPIEIWLGEPETADGRLLTTAMYHHPVIWNTYQPETYVLPERIRGIATLCLRLPRKAHVRGFRFARKVKAFSPLAAGSCDAISGDSYRREKDSVVDIGNNVTLLFEQMDFVSRATDRIRITGRTRNPKNTMQIRFVGPENLAGAEIRVVEFPGSHPSEGDQTIEFPFAPVSGLRDVTFLFLPGANFDFRSFTFLPEET